MLEFKAFKTYRAYATSEKAPKSKATKKKTDSESSPKTKPGSGDGVDILSKVPDEQQQTESSTNEGVGDKPEVPNHDSQRTKSDDSGDDFVYPNLSTYKADKEEQEKEEEKAEDDDEVIFDQKVSTPPNYELTEEDENQ
ncbi:hypothetical protein Tco_0049919 [Tanacetum coccineum]